MTQKSILSISIALLIVVSLLAYRHIHAPGDINTNDTSSSVQDPRNEDVKNNPVATPPDQDMGTNIISSAPQTPSSMHTEQFTLTQNETVHTKDSIIALTLTGFTIESDAPNPNLPHSPDPGIICPSFTLNLGGTEETVSVCIATQSDVPNRQTGSVKNAGGTVTISVLEMSSTTSPFGYPDTITVQIAY